MSDTIVRSVALIVLAACLTLGVLAAPVTAAEDPCTSGCLDDPDGDPPEVAIPDPQAETSPEGSDEALERSKPHVGHPAFDGSGDLVVGVDDVSVMPGDNVLIEMKDSDFISADTEEGVTITGLTTLGDAKDDGE